MAVGVDEDLLSDGRCRQHSVTGVLLPVVSFSLTVPAGIRIFENHSGAESYFDV